MNPPEDSSTEPTCPRCGAPFFAGKVGHLEALGCGACGGLWLDNAGTTEVLQRFVLDASQLARVVDAGAHSHEAPSPFAPAAFGCPVCKKPLASAKQADVTIDYCATHGTFFDRGELARVLRATGVATAPPVIVSQGPNLAEIQTAVRHDLAWQNDPLGTQLTDWLTGGKDWVNRWRR